MNKKDLSLVYFEAFATKDIDKLKSLLHPDVTLRDWDVNVKGRDKVLSLMDGNFKTFKLIAVHPTNIYQYQNFVIGELNIILDSLSLKVVDILEYCSDHKIIAIRAYKG